MPSSHGCCSAGDVLADQFVNHDSVAPGLSPTGGKGGTLRDITAAHHAFPDLDVTVADVFGGSGKVAVRVIVRGTHLGKLPGIAPTEKRTAVMGQEIWRVAGRRIIEHWGRFWPQRPGTPRTVVHDDTAIS